MMGNQSISLSHALASLGILPSVNGSLLLSESIATPAAFEKHAVPADDNQKMTACWKSIMAQNIVFTL